MGDLIKISQITTRSGGWKLIALCLNYVSSGSVAIDCISSMLEGCPIFAHFMRITTRFVVS